MQGTSTAKGLWQCHGRGATIGDADFLWCQAYNVASSLQGQDDHIAASESEKTLRGLVDACATAANLDVASASLYESLTSRISAQRALYNVTVLVDPAVKNADISVSEAMDAYADMTGFGAQHADSVKSVVYVRFKEKGSRVQVYVGTSVNDAAKRSRDDAAVGRIATDDGQPLPCQPVTQVSDTATRLCLERFWWLLLGNFRTAMNKIPPAGDMTMENWVAVGEDARSRLEALREDGLSGPVRFYGYDVRELEPIRLAFAQPEVTLEDWATEPDLMARIAELTNLMQDEQAPRLLIFTNTAQFSVAFHAACRVARDNAHCSVQVVTERGEVQSFDSAHWSRRELNHRLIAHQGLAIRPRWHSAAYLLVQRQGKDDILVARLPGLGEFGVLNEFGRDLRTFRDARVCQLLTAMARGHKEGSKTLRELSTLDPWRHRGEPVTQLTFRRSTIEWESTAAMSASNEVISRRGFYIDLETTWEQVFFETALNEHTAKTQDAISPVQGDVLHNALSLEKEDDGSLTLQHRIESRDGHAWQKKYDLRVLLARHEHLLDTLCRQFPEHTITLTALSAAIVPTTLAQGGPPDVQGVGRGMLRVLESGGRMAAYLCIWDAKQQLCYLRLGESRAPKMGPVLTTSGFYSALLEWDRSEGLILVHLGQLLPATLHLVPTQAFAGRFGTMVPFARSHQVWAISVNYVYFMRMVEDRLAQGVNWHKDRLAPAVNRPSETSGVRMTAASELWTMLQDAEQSLDIEQQWGLPSARLSDLIEAEAEDEALLDGGLSALARVAVEAVQLPVGFFDDLNRALHELQ